MSDLCIYELEDIAWDDFCQSDDHIVPHTTSERADDHSILGDGHKKPCHEVTGISNTTEDTSSAGYVDKGREPGFCSLSRRTNTMLEKDSLSNAPSGVFPSSSDSNSINKALSMAPENAISSHHISKNNKTDSNNNVTCANDTILGDKTPAVGNTSFSDALGDKTHAGNNHDLFENTEDKDSSELLYYGWPEIGNFEDVDSMFRSCSTFGLGTSKEDELSWYASADNIGGSEDIVKSEFDFSCPEPNPMEYITQNHDSSKSNFVNDFDMTKESSWTSEKSDSYMSFVNGPAMGNGEDMFIPEEQINENKKQVKLQNQWIGERKEHHFENGSFNYTSNLPNEAMPLPLSYVHSNNSPSSDLSSINLAPSAVKSETHDLISPSPRDDPQFPVVSPAVTGKREKLHNCQGSLSSAYGSLKNATATVPDSIVDPSLTVKQAQYSGDKSQSHNDAEGVSLVIPAELGSSHIQESSTMSSGMDDISQEAASFCQLQLVMEQLDLRTKICIRDSLYRLARSAEQRHNHAALNNNCGDESDAGGAFMTAGTNSFMDMETDTNPIDRSIAHLLFHRPSESSSVVRGSVTSPPVMIENLLVCEETASRIENDANH